MNADDRNEGVSPLFAPVLESLLDADLPMQVKHLARRGKLIAKCGSYDGQTTTFASEVTCAACQAKGAKR